MEYVGAILKLKSDVSFMRKRSSRGMEPRLYGRKGDDVLIIGDHDNIMVVEHTVTKERFPVMTDNLEYDRELQTDSY